MKWRRKERRKLNVAAISFEFRVVPLAVTSTQAGTASGSGSDRDHDIRPGDPTFESDSKSEQSTSPETPNTLITKIFSQYISSAC